MSLDTEITKKSLPAGNKETTLLIFKELDPLYRDRYRVESARLKGWDYALQGWYFVTICTRERECLFGEIVEGEMVLSAIGEIVVDEWQKTEKSVQM